MAFPQVAATNSGVESANATSHTINLPSGISSGDLLIILFGQNAVSAGSITWPSGWTEVFWVANPNNEGFLGIAVREADGSEGSTVTIGTSLNRQSAHQTYRITGHNGIAGFDAAVENSNGDDVDPPNLAPIWGTAKDVLWFAVLLENGSESSMGYPTNYTNGAYAGLTSGSNRVVVASARRELNAASENPGAFTPALGWGSVAATLAIEPSDGGGGVVHEQSVGGSISVSGNLTENIKLPLTSTIDIAAGLAFASFLGIAVGSTIGISGALVNITKFSLTSILSISGNLVNKAKLVLSSSLSITGILTAGTKFLQAIIGTLTSSGNVSTIYDEEGGVPSSGKRGHSIFGAISKRIRKGRRRRRR